MLKVSRFTGSTGLSAVVSCRLAVCLWNEKSFSHLRRSQREAFPFLPVGKGARTRHLSTRASPSPPRVSPARNGRDKREST